MRGKVQCILTPIAVAGLDSRGLQFCIFFGIQKGIKQRTVYIAKILHFYFRQNAYKMPLFERLCSKFTKSTNMTPKMVYFQNTIWVLKMLKIVLISNLLIRL